MTENSTSPSTTGSGILVVCRGPRLVQTLASIFAQTGDRIITADCASSAWECLRLGGIGLIILDLTAASLDDVYFFHHIRNTSTTYDIPFLFLVRREYPLPAFSVFGEEIVRDEWLAMPCTAKQLIEATSRLSAMRAEDIAADAQENIVDLNETRTPLPAESAPEPVDYKPKSKETQHAAKAIQEENAQGTSKVNPIEAPTGILSGRLGAIDVAKILTIIEPLGLTGNLTVDNGKRQGKIWFDKGHVRHAELADISGPDALFLLFHMKKGFFKFEACELPAEKTIQESNMHLLLEGLRQMDETQEAISAMQANREARESRKLPAPEKSKRKLPK